MFFGLQGRSYLKQSSLGKCLFFQSHREAKQEEETEEEDEEK